MSKFKAGDRVWDKTTDLRGTVLSYIPETENMKIVDLEGPDINWAGNEQDGFPFNERFFILCPVYEVQLRFKQELKELLED
jgi:hypothetical protein